VTAKPGHCRFSASTICACWLVNSARTLLNSAAATCGDSCLDPVEVGSSCVASGNAEDRPSGLCLSLAPRRKEFCEFRVATDQALILKDWGRLVELRRLAAGEWSEPHENGLEGYPFHDHLICGLVPPAFRHRSIARVLASAADLLPITTAATDP
jgi:hypothetical protein